MRWKMLWITRSPVPPTILEDYHGHLRSVFFLWLILDMFDFISTQNHPYLSHFPTSSSPSHSLPSSRVKNKEEMAKRRRSWDDDANVWWWRHKSKMIAVCKNWYFSPIALCKHVKKKEVLFENLWIWARGRPEIRIFVLGHYPDFGERITCVREREREQKYWFCLPVKLFWASPAARGRHNFEISPSQFFFLRIQS